MDTNLGASRIFVFKILSYFYVDRKEVDAMAGRKDSRGRILKQGECQRKDGRYSYAYTDPFGKRRYIYANDLMKLRSREQQLQKDQLDGLDIYTAGKATVNYVFDRYLSMKSELRPSTYTSYVYMYDRYVRDTFGKKLVAEVKYSDVMFFYEHLMQNYKLQVGTVDKIHTLIHPIFKLAVRDSIIRINPADGCMAEIKKKSTTGANKRKALTIPQQKAFIDYTQHSEVYYRWAPLFTVLLGTGCRVGEIIGLRWEDVDFAERTININHSVSYRADAKDDFRCSYSVSKPKTEAGIRNVPMLDAVYEALQDEKRYQKIDGSNEMTIDGMSGFIFRNRYGAVHNPQGINKAIKRVYAYLQSKIDEYEINIELVDMAVSGSRCRGLEKAGSDLDVVVEYKGRETEDDLFNAFNEDGFMIGGVRVDINPITEGKTGTLGEYLPGVETYLEGVREAREKEPRSIFSIRMNDEERFFENTSSLDADALCRAYGECEKPFVEMGQYGRWIDIGEYAAIEQGDRLAFSVQFNEETDKITIFDGENFEYKGLRETVYPDQEEKNVRITLTVAECGEFHNFGEYHEDIAGVEEAAAIFNSIPPERRNAVPSIGINIHTEGTESYEDAQMDIVSGSVIDLEMLEYYPEITGNQKALEVISELISQFPDAEVLT